MPEPELPVVAEGETSRGEHWYLSAGGTPADYYTMLKTVHSDGHWDEGGMGGPPLYAGEPLNSYLGRADDGPLRVIVRTDPRVRRVVVHGPRGQSCELLPCGEDPRFSLAFFAVVLPWATWAVTIEGFDAAGQPVG